jgi:Transmembrane secretion effector
MGWTISASELWVAAQRAMPSWARGRMIATVIVISQGAMALGGLIWGSTGAIAGPNYTLFGAAVLFLTSLFLIRRFRSTLRRTPKRGAIYRLVRNQNKKAGRSLNNFEKIMNDKKHENGAPTSPLIFSVPSWGFVVA